MRRIVLGIAVAVTSLMPTLGVADDQQIADFIKSRLQVEQQKGNLRGFNVDMRVDRGTVWFKGHVSQEDQEMTILRTAQLAGHLGVVQVVDDIEVKKPGAKSVMETAAMPQPKELKQATPMQRPTEMKQMAMQQPMGGVQLPMPANQPKAVNQQQLMNAAYQQQPTASNPYRQTSRQEFIKASKGAAGGIMAGGQPLPFANNGAPGQPPQQYMADGYMGGGAPMAASYASAGMPAEAPNLPGYAWPGYAAHPNYGAVTYPKQYSPSAWPYIGPFYPYPQVPLGWRRVSLEWDDGWWMLDFHDK